MKLVLIEEEEGKNSHIKEKVLRTYIFRGRRRDREAGLLEMVPCAGG